MEWGQVLLIPSYPNVWMFMCVSTHTHTHAQCLNVYTFPIYNFSFTSYTIKKLKNKNKKLFSLSLNTHYVPRSLSPLHHWIRIQQKKEKYRLRAPLSSWLEDVIGTLDPTWILSPLATIVINYIRVCLVGSTEKWDDRKWGVSGIVDG